jgi:hypothetical protein
MPYIRSGSWKDQLTAAFEILLGRPLTSYDPGAVYATFFDGDVFCEIDFSCLFHRPCVPAWLDQDALDGRKTITIDGLSLYYRGEPPLQFDASGSVFELDLTALPEAAASKLTAACFSSDDSYGLITGRSVSAVLKDFSPGLPAGCWSVAYPRIASDGSLWDAMRAATGLGLTPATLIPFNQEASEPWRTRLATISHPGLKAHLALGCGDHSRAEGLIYHGTGGSGGYPLEKEGCGLIANWEERDWYCQVSVVQLSAKIV